MGPNTGSDGSDIFHLDEDPPFYRQGQNQQRPATTGRARPSNIRIPRSSWRKFGEGDNAAAEDKIPATERDQRPAESHRSQADDQRIPARDNQIRAEEDEFESAKERIMAHLLHSCAPILGSDGGAECDGAIYEGPVEIEAIDQWPAPLTAVNQALAPNVPHTEHRFKPFNVREIQLRPSVVDRNDIEVSIFNPCEPTSPISDKIDLHLVAYGPHSCSSNLQFRYSSQDGGEPMLLPYDMVALLTLAQVQDLQANPCVVKRQRFQDLDLVPPGFIPCAVPMEELGDELEALMQRSNRRFEDQKWTAKETLKGLPEVRYDVNRGFMRLTEESMFTFMKRPARRRQGGFSGRA